MDCTKTVTATARDDVNVYSNLRICRCEWPDAISIGSKKCWQATDTIKELLRGLEHTHGCAVGLNVPIVIILGFDFGGAGLFKRAYRFPGKMDHTCFHGRIERSKFILILENCYIECWTFSGINQNMWCLELTNFGKLQMKLKFSTFVGQTEWVF